MITIPLATVVSYLTRKGVDFACLEGAPFISFGCLYAVRPTDIANPDGHKHLFIGRDAVCPAAMGWAATLLGQSNGSIVDEDGRILLWRRGERLWSHLWAWDNRSVPGEDITTIDGPTPPTPAARLRAVLEYEMGRI